MPSPHDDLAVSKKYVKKSHVEHILSRPDTYVGSTVSSPEQHWVLAEDKSRIHKDTLEYSPGLYKIFDEILNNAIDQSVIDESVTFIKAEVKPGGWISIHNNGSGIPICKHAEHDVYIPEMIFAHLLTSTNYDDSQERIVGGRNGYGAKLTNIFSKEFIIDILDPKAKLNYVQRFSDNMSVIDKPKVKASSAKCGYVKISFLPDFAKFGIKSDDVPIDMIRIFERRLWDTAACTRQNVSVYWNSEKLPVKNFEKYVDLYLGDKRVPRVVEKNDRWEIVAAISAEGFQHVSFINGIATYRGGTHLNYCTQTLIEKIRTSSKKAQCARGYDIKERLFMFVKSTLVNPCFTSQTKEEGASKVGSWGSKPEIGDDFVKKVIKLGVLENALEESVNRELAKTDGKKKNILRIPKLEDATKAGTAESHLCTLILTEGDSAKTFAISGMSVTGREYWGVFPLKGKLLNVRDASSKQVVENAEINNIKQIIGLQHGKEYTDSTSLRYGHVMVMTDADVDGSHIKGLILNLFHCFWPSLLKLGYVTTMATPIVKAFHKTRKNDELQFYNLNDYNTWKRSTILNEYKIKYYKGLGTSTSQEAREYFKDIGTRTLMYVSKDDQATVGAMELAFKKVLASDRKVWIKEHTVDPSELDARQDGIPVSGQMEIPEFIDKELVLFSIADVIRSLPSLCDGLKPSQRKVMYACLKRRITNEMRVSQLASAVGEMTSYHHGDASLCATIVNMAQGFVGSNNLPLLQGVGQFGTRLQGGKDASQPRYIHTHLAEYTPLILNKHDAKLLTYLDDDGTPIEPKYFVPVLPMILINGSEGIGTGYSTFVPSYKPSDVIHNIKRILNDDEPQEMVPWYRNFNGTIEKVGSSVFAVHGKATVMQTTARHTTVEVTELPIGYWTQDFKEHIESDKSPVESYENMSTEAKVKFILKIPAERAQEIQETGLLKYLGLTKTMHTSNMHLFDENGKIVKYDTSSDILKAFCMIRLGFYKMRKENMLKEMEASSHEMETKMRFLKLVLSNELVIFKRPTPDIMIDLAHHDLDAKHLKTPVSDFTQEQIDKLEDEINRLRDEIRTLTDTSAVQLWLRDLDDIQVQVELYEENNNGNEDVSNSQTRAPQVKRRRKAPLQK